MQLRYGLGRFAFAVTCAAMFIGLSSGGREGLAAQKIPIGTITPQVRCKADPSQSYAVYLPKGYTSSRVWPVVYGYSPSGTGMEVVQHLRSGAQLYGYIVVGSNNAKNGPWPPIEKAIRHLEKDVRKRFSVDRKRQYACGFSGGARMSFWMANRYKLRGVIACSGGFSGEGTCPKKTRVHALCGVSDPNRPELEDVVKQLGWPHNKKIVFSTFSGGHAWPPDDLLKKALYKMDPQYADSYRP
jgi:dienelactone hydrolase